MWNYPPSHGTLGEAQVVLNAMDAPSTNNRANQSFETTQFITRAGIFASP